MTTPTQPQLSALLWLVRRNGDGLFDKNNVLVASGERAPVMRSTWSKLETLGLVERYGNRNKRLRITVDGAVYDLRGVEESEGPDDEEDEE
jgi:hypothetical protein